MTSLTSKKSDATWKNALWTRAKDLQSRLPDCVIHIYLNTLVFRWNKIELNLSSAQDQAQWYLLNCDSDEPKIQKLLDLGKLDWV